MSKTLAIAYGGSHISLLAPAGRTAQALTTNSRQCLLLPLPSEPNLADHFVAVMTDALHQSTP